MQTITQKKSTTIVCKDSLHTELSFQKYSLYALNMIVTNDKT